MSKAGFSLVMVLFVLSTMTIVITTAMRSSLLHLDLALQRFTYEQQRWAAQGIVNYGIAYAHKHAATLVKNKGSSNIAVDNVCANLLPNYSGSCLLTPGDGVIAVRAELKKNQEIAIAMGCTCEVTFDRTDPDKEKLASFGIRDWHIDEAIN